MGSSGDLGSVITMPLELAATALSRRRRISSEAGRLGSCSYRVREDCAFNISILQPRASTGYAFDPNVSDVKGSPFQGMYSEETERKLREEQAENGLRASTTALRLRCPGTRHRRTDHAPPPRKAPQHLRHQPKRSHRQAPRGRPRQPRGAPRQHRL